MTRCPMPRRLTAPPAANPTARYPPTPEVVESALSPRPFASLPPLLVLACAGLAAPALAQPPTPAPPPPPAAPVTPAPADVYDGWPIREVRILLPAEGTSEPQPAPPAVAQLVRNQLRLLEGRPFSRQSVSDDVARLTRLGRFRTIRSEVQPLQDSTVILTYILERQPVIQDVQVVGNRELSDQELLGAVGVLAGTAQDPFQIDRAARAIEGLYRSRGYHQARVEVDERELSESSIVVFRVIEGDAARVMGIRFRGNNSFSDRELRSAIRTTEYFPIFERGPIDQDVLIGDAAELVRFYRDRGHLDVQVGTPFVRLSPDNREAIIEFDIAEGPLYTLRSVQVFYRTEEALRRYREEVLQSPQRQVSYLTVEQMRQLGYKPLSHEQVLGAMVIKPGDVYSDDKLRRSLESIRTTYAKLGYIRDAARGPISVLLDDQIVRDENEPLVDLILFIAEGQPTLTGEVSVTGNEHTKMEVILQEVRIRPGRPLDLKAVEESVRLLEQRRLFAPGSVRITVQPADPPGATHRDVSVEVQEHNTGSFTFGAAVSSDASVTGQISLSQRNFDIADVPDSWEEFISGRAFRGAGQTFSIDLAPGNQVQTYAVSLTDPTLLDTDYSGSIAGFYRKRIYRKHDEDRYGVRASIGRRFGQVWEGNLLLRNEWVELSDIDDDAPVDIFDDRELSRLGIAGLQLSRTTVDNRLRPSHGTRLSFGIEQAGALGGDYSFTKLDAGYTSFFTLYESFLGYKTVLKLSGQAGYIPQGQGSTPVFERFYLGGNSFRGFAFRGVSPRGIRNDTGELGRDPVGGTFMFFAGAELNQPVYRDVVSLVGFVDSGTVDTDVSLDRYRVSTGFGVRLFVPQISPIPLAFDFGFPLVKEPGDRQRLFTFSIDLPFQ
jgi:outer membrane protein insertion porin family